MSLEKKLRKKEEEGILIGYQDTWSFFEEAMKEVNGIGPKRSQAVLDKVMEKARDRYKKEMRRPDSIMVVQTRGLERRRKGSVHR
ncbi:hypothetical protein [Brevibacillus reuszeri]|uniref:hypothetical protein n=1 Tax=Brevibacillus reuszeri TaxID=54915 RepID=UPI000CCC6A51|nr:hypothetical protein [Brevibacillus reuszeri]